MAEVALLECSVEGCAQPKRKRTWCASHYAQWQRTGEVKPFAYKWADRGSCKLCGKPCSEYGRRTFCSGACQAKWSYHQGDIPPARPCDFCGADFTPKNHSKFDLRWCPDCLQTPDVQRYRRYAVTPEQYRAALESGCSICSQVVEVLHVDHNHDCCPGTKQTCGQCVRGFLCGPCNRAIGLFKDSPTTLLRAADYLLRGDDLSPR